MKHNQKNCYIIAGPKWSKHMTNSQKNKIEKLSQETIYEELIKKAKLGQYAIIQKDGKTCRVPAAELIKTMKKPEQLLDATSTAT